MATPQNNRGEPVPPHDARRAAAERRRRFFDDPAPEQAEDPGNLTETTNEFDEPQRRAEQAQAEETFSDEDEARGWAAMQNDDDDILDEDVMDGEEEEDYEYDEMEDTAPIFDAAAMGLKEINNLAHFRVSSHKPGNAVPQLLSDNTDEYWQSDGQQPHLLTIHFIRRVEIRAIRFFVDYAADESYTPIHVVWLAGTGHHDLMQFGEQHLTSPSGWQDVDVDGLGGGEDGNSLCCFIVQMHVKENHQNGKDTHIRGIKVYALDDNAPRREERQLGEIAGFMDARDQEEGVRAGRRDRGARWSDEDAFLDAGFMGTDELLPPPNSRSVSLAGLTLPDFMKEAEIR